MFATGPPPGRPTGSPGRLHLHRVRKREREERERIEREIAAAVGLAMYGASGAPSHKRSFLRRGSRPDPPDDPGDVGPVLDPGRYSARARHIASRALAIRHPSPAYRSRSPARRRASVQAVSAPNFYVSPRHYVPRRRFWQRSTRFRTMKMPRGFRRRRFKRVKRFRRRFARVKKFFRRYGYGRKRKGGRRSRFRSRSRAQVHRWSRQPNVNRVVQVSYCTNRIVLGIPFPIGTNVDTVTEPYRWRDSTIWKTQSRYGELDYCIPLEPMWLAWISQTVPYVNPVYGAQSVVPDGLANPGGINLTHMLGSLRLMCMRDLRPDPGITSKASMWQYVPSSRPMLTTTNTTLPEYKIAWMKISFRPARLPGMTRMTAQNEQIDPASPVTGYASGAFRGLMPGHDVRLGGRMRWQWRMWKNSAVASIVYPNESVVGASLFKPNVGLEAPFNASGAEDGWSSVRGLLRKFFRPRVPRGSMALPSDGSLDEMGNPIAPTTASQPKYDHRYAGWRKYGDTNFKVPSATGGITAPGVGQPWNFPSDTQVNADKKWALPGGWLQLRFVNCQQFMETHFPNATNVPIWPVFGEVVIQSKILWRGVAESVAFQSGNTAYPNLPDVPDIAPDGFSTAEHGDAVPTRERDLENTIYDYTL